MFPLGMCIMQTFAFELIIKELIHPWTVWKLYVLFQVLLKPDKRVIQGDSSHSKQLTIKSTKLIVIVLVFWPLKVEYMYGLRPLLRYFTLIWGSKLDSKVVWRDHNDKSNIVHTEFIVNDKCKETDTNNENIQQERSWYRVKGMKVLEQSFSRNVSI